MIYDVKIVYESGRAEKEIVLPFEPQVGFIIDGQTVSWKIFEVRWNLDSGIFICKAEMIERGSS
jgi:hypothetical protein